MRLCQPYGGKIRWARGAVKEIGDSTSLNFNPGRCYLYCLRFSLHSQNNSYNLDLIHAIAVFSFLKISWASARDEEMRRGIIISPLTADVVLVIVLSAASAAAQQAACRAIYYPKSQWWSPVDEKWSVLRVSTTTGLDRIITGLSPCTLMSPIGCRNENGKAASLQRRTDQMMNYVVESSKQYKNPP